MMSKYIKENYDKVYNTFYYGKMREKLGLYCFELPEDQKLIDALFDTMNDNASDFTNTFRKLSEFEIPLKPNEKSESNYNKILDQLVSFSADLDALLSQSKPALSEDQIIQIKMMSETNMHFLLMMGIDPDMVEMEEEKWKKYKQIQDLKPEELTASIRKRWTTWLNQYSARLYQETLAISLDNGKGENEESKGTDKTKPKLRVKSYEELTKMRAERMNKTNPIYILRNYMAEEAIARATEGDNSGLKTLFEILLNPFDDVEKGEASKKYKDVPPKWASEICVSCSS